jgi:UDP:flavonoid glycosyltransferase YjiC (YdhE family)
MRHVLIVWELGGNLGHLSRLHLIASALAYLKINVTFAVRNYPLAAPWLAARGWPCLQAPQLASNQWDSTIPVGHADWYVCEGFDQPAQVQTWLGSWAALVEQNPCDALLLDFAPAAVYAAHYLQLPYMVSSVGFCVPPYFHQAACFRPWDLQAVQQAQAAHAHLPAMFGALRKLLGPQAAVDLEALYPPHAVQLCTFKHIDHFADRSEDANYAGVLWNTAQDVPQTTWHPSKGAGKKVFCYLNGAVEHTHPLLDALKKHACEVIAVVPHWPKDRVDAYATEHFQVHTQPVNVQALLPDADAVVTHGGVGLVGQSLCAGVPLLLLAQHAEQALLARRVAQHSFGLATYRSTDTQLLADRLDALLHDPRFGVATRAFANQHPNYSPNEAAHSAMAAWVEAA